MAYNQLRRGQSARNVTTVYFMEELEKAGYTYWDFLEYCDSLHIPMVVSPVHDQDEYTVQDVKDWMKRHSDKTHYSYITSDLEELEKVAPKIGDKKKAHIHFAVKLDGKRRGSFFSELFEDFISIPDTRWQRVVSWDGTVRYFAHMDSPEKYQYSSMDIQAFGGAELSMLVNPDKVSRTKTLMFIKKEMYDHDFRYFHQLDRWAYGTGDVDIINMVAGRSSYFNSIFSSKRHERQDKRQDREDKKAESKL